MFSVFDSAWDVREADAIRERLLRARRGRRGAAGHDVDQALQRVHGRVRGVRPAPHEALRDDPAPARRGGRQEPSRIRVHNPLSQYRDVVHGRRGAGGAADHLSADAADVLADLGRCGRHGRVHRGRAAQARHRPKARDPRAGIGAADGQRPRSVRARQALHRAGGEARLREGRHRTVRRLGRGGARRHCDGRDHPGREPRLLRLRRRRPARPSAATPRSAGASR